MESAQPSPFFHALHLDGQGGATKLSPQELGQLTALPENTWLHLDFNHADTEGWLRQCSGIPELAIRGLLAQDTRPRLLSRENRLLLTVRGVNLNPDSDPEDMVSARIWTDGHRLVSTQTRRLRSTDDVVSSLQGGIGPVSLPELLLRWLDRIVERMTSPLAQLEEAVLDLEDAALAGEQRVLGAEYAALRRRCIVLRRYLAPQREALTRLASEPLPWLLDADRLRVRDIADRQIRHIETIEEIRERCALAYEEVQSRLSEQMNKRMYVLSLAAALFLPLGFFTGLMGINVGGMPGVDSTLGFWVVAGLCGVCLTALLLVFKKEHWL